MESEIIQDSNGCVDEVQQVENGKEKGIQQDLNKNIMLNVCSPSYWNISLKGK